MNLLARRLYELGDTDIKPGDFWEKYRTQEDFVNEMLKVAPGRPNVGQPLPYPNLPEGYVLYGTPDSLEEGRVTIDHEKKEVRGEPVTVEWLRKHNGVVVWPMSWYRYRKFDPTLGDYVPNGVWPPTKTKKVEFHFYHYDSYNKKIDEAQEVPPGLKVAGFDRYPSTFYWFETQWNPYTNPKFKEYAREYPFQLITGRVHHAMTGTQMLPWLGQVVSEGLWMPMNREFEHEIVDQDPRGLGATKLVRKRFRPGTFGVGTILMNIQDGEKLGLKSGDLVEVVNPLGHKTRGQVFLSHSIRPGVIKIGFGTGGRFSPGLGATYKQREYTPNHNALVDPRCLSPIMGFPCFADMMVKVVKV
jgi:anaerobic selenocysteine-containing dehydrogenase